MLLEEVTPGFETGVEYEIAFGMLLTTMQPMALFDVSAQVTSVQEGSVAIGFFAAEGQNARVLVAV